MKGGPVCQKQRSPAPLGGWTAKELGNDPRSEVIWTVVKIHTIPLLIVNFCTAHPINNTSCSYLHFASLFSHHFTFSQPVNAERISWDGCSRDSSVLARTLVILAYLNPLSPYYLPLFYMPHSTSISQSTTSNFLPSF